MKRRSLTRSLAAIAAAAMVIAACGEGESDDATEAATSEVEPEEADSDGAEDTDDAPVEDDDDRADWPDPLVLAGVPSEDAGSLAESYGFLAQILEEETGVEVELFQAADYAGVVEAIVAGRVHIGSFGPFAYVLATSVGADVEVVGVMTGGPDVEPGYTASMHALADNDDVATLDDVAGRNVCMVDPASTSGYLVPYAVHLDADQQPDEDFNIVLAGGHDTSVIALLDGTCDAAWAFTGILNNLAEGGDLDVDDIKIVEESFLIAGPPAAMWLGLPDELQDIIRDTFRDKANTDYAIEAGFCESEEECSFVSPDVWGWVPGDDADFDGIRDLCTQLGDEVRACEGIA